MELKTILSIYSKSKCHLCDIPFVIETPGGANYVSCPFCNWDPDSKNPNGHHDNYYRDSDPMFEDIIFCFKCNVLYQMGCMHAVKGCTDDIHHSMFCVPKDVEITQFSDIKIPVFSSYDDAYAFLKDDGTKDKYRWVCSCKLQGNKKICSRAYYPQDKFPQYYHSCK